MSRKAQHRAIALETRMVCLRNSSKILSKKNPQTDVLSVFAGLRPLAAPDDLEKALKFQKDIK
jgi:glycerol-3-phosphate dehydrogenase